MKSNGYSNLIGSTKDRIFPSTATPSSQPNTTLHGSVSTSTIAALQQQKQDLNAKLTEAQEALSKNGNDRQGCKKGKVIKKWDNGCLDRNTALSDSLKRDIANYQQRLTDLDTQITSAQKQYEAAKKAESEALTAQAAAREKELLAQAKANPETALYAAKIEEKKVEVEQKKAEVAAQVQKEQAASAAQVQTEKTKLMLYAGIGVAALGVIVLIAVLLLRK